MSLDIKSDEFKILNTIDMGVKGRFGPGREADYRKVATDKDFKHALSRGAIEYPLKKEVDEVDTRIASGSDAESPNKKTEPEFEATGEWRTEEGINKNGESTGWWRIVDPEGKFVTNKREDEAKEFVAEKNEASESSDEE